MGDPSGIALYKVEGDDRTHEIPEDREASFLERMKALGLRVTKPTSLGPLSGEHYGPEDPGLADEAPPAGERRLPKGFGVADTVNKHGVDNLVQQRPVPPQPYFPPKDPALAASDNAAVADAIANGRNTADVPLRGGAPIASGTGESLPGGVPDEEPEAAFGSPASDMDGDADAGVGESEGGPRNRRALENAWVNGDGIPPGDRTYGRGVTATKIEPPDELEATWRGALDVGGAGIADEAAGLGGMVYELLNPTAHPVGRGADAPVLSRSEAISGAGEGAMKKWAKRDEQAFDAHPGYRLLGGAVPAIAQSVVAQALAPAARAAQAASKAGQAVEAVAPARDIISRSAAGATEALLNPGNAALAAAQGVGHAEGPSLPEWLASAATGTAGEMAFGAAMAPFAEALLKPFRWMGGQVEKKLLDPLATEEAPLHQAARNAGAEYETFRKPAESLTGRPYTSERGMRPGPSMQNARVAAKEAGSGMPGERERLSAATRTAGVLDDQDQQLFNNLREDRATYQRSSEGSKGYPVDDFFTGVDPEIRQELLAEVRRLRVSDADLHGREAYTPEGTVNARVFDRLLDHIDFLAKTQKADAKFGPEAAYSDLSSRLHAIRRTEDVFPGAAWIAENHAQSMREHEALKTQMGLPAGTRGVDRTELGGNVTAIDRRLSQGASPALSRATEQLEQLDPEIGTELRNWVGIDAQQKLMSGARAAQGPATVGATGPARPRFRLPDLSPGMRAAGMANLGPYSNAGLRGGLREGAQELLSSGDEVTPEIALEKVRWLANLLGYDNQSPADLQRLIQMIEGQQQP